MNSSINLKKLAEMSDMDLQTLYKWTLIKHPDHATRSTAFRIMKKYLDGKLSTDKTADALKRALPPTGTHGFTDEQFFTEREAEGYGPKESSLNIRLIQGIDMPWDILKNHIKTDPELMTVINELNQRRPDLVNIVVDHIDAIGDYINRLKKEGVTDPLALAFKIIQTLSSKLGQGDVSFTNLLIMRAVDAGMNPAEYSKQLFTNVEKVKDAVKDQPVYVSTLDRLIDHSKKNLMTREEIDLVLHYEVSRHPEWGINPETFEPVV